MNLKFKESFSSVQHEFRSHQNHVKTFDCKKKQRRTKQFELIHAPFAKDLQGKTKEIKIDFTLLESAFFLFPWYF